MKKNKKSEAWRKLKEVLDEVHAQNPDATEEEVIKDVEKAVDEVRQEQYAKRKQV